MEVKKNVKPTCRQEVRVRESNCHRSVFINGAELGDGCTGDSYWEEKESRGGDKAFHGSVNKSTVL